ncbi:hypothetical protein KAM353_36870 [Aeromonas caviae]|uniref:Uncharacterized protein n=1 Tax=Aeromonas caviae TaxID=648 RepID=A0AA37D2F7_AERCA|nr:hypothetical protein KAM336_41870 [Aeromonas caviae]GJA30041.1 hypothetical protein KAM340_42080 [Aeromonas caviae]GJA65351.1 hypothetical protein KAM351_39620 [Aeromonas caviae]GJA74040.1 hypothetical protein KAM353_36870 [Aeromonas caviae]
MFFLIALTTEPRSIGIVLSDSLPPYLMGFRFCYQETYTHHSGQIGYWLRNPLQAHIEYYGVSVAMQICY